MFDDKATAPTLVALADSTEEGLLPPSAVARLVASVWPRPYDGPEAFLPAARPLLENQRTHPGETICVIADYQLLLSSGGRDGHAEAVYDTAAALLALGVDPRNTSLCRESDVAALPEVYWLLSCALWLPPPPGVEASTALPQGVEDAARARALLLTALAVGLGASSLVLASASPEPGASLSSLLREIGLRLNPGQTPVEVLREGAADGPASLGAALDLGAAGARYEAIRHNAPFLRDVLSEGALAAATVSRPAVARLREYLHLGDGGTSRP